MDDQLRSESKIINEEHCQIQRTVPNYCLNSPCALKFSDRSSVRYLRRQREQNYHYSEENALTTKFLFTAATCSLNLNRHRLIWSTTQLIMTFAIYHSDLLTINVAIYTKVIRKTFQLQQWSPTFNTDICHFSKIESFLEGTTYTGLLCHHHSISHNWKWKIQNGKNSPEKILKFNVIK